MPEPLSARSKTDLDMAVPFARRAAPWLFFLMAGVASLLGVPVTAGTCILVGLVLVEALKRDRMLYAMAVKIDWLHQDIQEVKRRA